MSTVAGSARQWQLSRAAAEAYERNLVPLLFAPGAEFLVELAGVAAGDRVLDLACGTGIVARTAAGFVGESGAVAGVDLNEAMLAVARGAAASLKPAVDWRCADAADLPFGDGSFDVVLCQQGLQFFPDRDRALREANRVLVAGGRIAVSVLRSLEHNPGCAVYAEVLERRVGDDAGAMMRSPFADFTTGRLRDLIAGAGFEEVRILHGIAPVRYPSAEEMVELESTSSPMGAEIGALPADRRAALVADLAMALSDLTDDAGVVFPASTYLVTARKGG